MKSVQQYFQQQPHNRSSISGYFFGIQHKLLVEVDEVTHQISLSFANPPTWRNFDPIKELHLFESVYPIKPFERTEFAFKFGKVVSLMDVARLIVQDYQNLGYQCSVAIKGEVFEVGELLNRTATAFLHEAPSCT